MSQQISILGSIFISFVCAAAARADHFAIDLEVKTGKAKEVVHAEALEPGSKAKVRAILQVPAGQEIEIQWTVTCTAKQGTFKDVLVHFFIVKETMVGQPGTPKVDKDAPAESALTMDFKPNEKAKGQMKVKLSKPGPYLLRLETIGAAKGTESHEHFAVLDLLVNEEKAK